VISASQNRNLWVERYADTNSPCRIRSVILALTEWERLCIRMKGMRARDHYRPEPDPLLSRL